MARISKTWVGLGFTTQFWIFSPYDSDFESQMDDFGFFSQSQHYQSYLILKTKSSYDANFVITGGTIGCLYEVGIMFTLSFQCINYNNNSIHVLNKHSLCNPWTHKCNLLRIFLLSLLFISQNITKDIMYAFEQEMVWFQASDEPLSKLILKVTVILICHRVIHQVNITIN